MKHTKGPWRAIKYQNTSYYKVTQDFKTYGIDAKDLAGCETDLRFHDAHLIAAAPEMLEALEKALHDLEALRLSTDEADYPLEVMNYLDTYMLEMFKQAIRKAKGEG